MSDSASLELGRRSVPERGDLVRVLVREQRGHDDVAGVHPVREERGVGRGQGVEAVGEDDDGERPAAVVGPGANSRCGLGAPDRGVPDLGDELARPGASSRRRVHDQAGIGVGVCPDDGPHAHTRLCHRRARARRWSARRGGADRLGRSAAHDLDEADDHRHEQSEREEHRQAPAPVDRRWVAPPRRTPGRLPDETAGTAHLRKSTVPSASLLPASLRLAGGAVGSRTWSQLEVLAP